MKNKNEGSAFTFKYTAPTEEERRRIESIRSQYIKSEPKSESKAERLHRLHAAVTGSAKLISLVVGIAGTLIFGLGMALALEWELWLAGVAVGIVGALPMVLAYPIYRCVLKMNKEKHGEEIIRLSDELLSGDTGEI